MIFQDSSISKHVFNEHSENPSMVGGMPLTELLSSSRFVGGDRSRIDEQIFGLDNPRFKNLVVPAGFYVERGIGGGISGGITSGGISSNTQYINEKAFEELFNIPIRNQTRSRSNRNKNVNGSHKRTKKTA